MATARYRHRLEIQQPATVQGASGQEVPNWTPFATLWAGIEPIKGKESLAANQVLGELDTRIVLRWSPLADQIKDTFRGLHQGVVYNFATPAHHNLARREIEIMAKSGRNDG